VRYHISLKGTSVISFFGRNKGGEPVPLRLSEVNRMLGKVDELANADTRSIPFNLGETIRLLTDL
jgi:transcriptional antiterminator NusG